MHDRSEGNKSKQQMHDRSEGNKSKQQKQQMHDKSEAIALSPFSTPYPHAR
jgi:hypothetical protein